MSPASRSAVVKYYKLLSSNESVTYQCDLVQPCNPVRVSMWLFVGLRFYSSVDTQFKVATSQSSKGWLSHVNAKFIPLQNGLIRIGECDPNRGQPYFHLQYITRRNGELETTCLTQGNFEVLEIISYDPVTYQIYFISTEQPPDDPVYIDDKLNGAERSNLWSMKIRESKINKSTRLLKRNCETCPEGYRPCKNWQVKDVKEGGMFLRSCLGPSVPFDELVVPR